ncbi:MAG: type I-E CRISPR-associated protein Cas7/Cse4/CasC [Pseudomonadales bacterium]|nr:type I-E CRISPR-associated protein Cas7/Cse4/CasC [Pseudomonadales bacterium]
MSRNYLNMHVLISHSPSCLNRDDMNMQKSAIFGGKRRVRISSQSLKRAIRISDYYAEKLGAHSIRTRELTLLAERMHQALTNDATCDLDKKWIDLGVEIFANNKVDPEEGEEEASENEAIDAAATGNKVAVTPWSINEFKLICETVKEVFESPLTDKESASLKKATEKEKGRKPTKKKPKKEPVEIEQDFLTKKVKKKLEASATQLQAACGSAVDIALSGRMATSGLMTSIDGALAVAHAITTHSIDADIDWFTAVDDLILEEGDVGAGHLNTQEFSSGVFYRYASLNIAQLQKNLGDATRMRALEIASHFIHLFATVVPSAKQQTFAAHNLADTVLLSFADQPLSLANAFEAPIKADLDGGFRQPSSSALLSHHRKLTDAYGLNDKSQLFTLLDTVVAEQNPPSYKKANSMRELTGWVMAQE